MTSRAAPRRPGWRLGVFDAGLALAAVGLAVLVHKSAEPLTLAALGGAVVLLVWFAVVEITPMHLEWSGQAYSLSLSEVPFVVGLLCWPSLALVAARVLGGATALAIHRKQPARKLAFNIANQALEVTLGMAVYLSIPGHLAHNPMLAAPAALAAVTASMLVSMAGVAAVIQLSVGRIDRRVVRSFARSGMLSLPVNVSLALTVVAAARLSAWTIGPMAVVLVGGTSIYHAYVRLRQRHTTLGTLYEFTRGLQYDGSTEARMRDLLKRTRDMLKAEVAGVLLDEADQPPTLHWVDDSGVLHTESYVPGPRDWPFARVMSSGALFVVSRFAREPGIAEFLAHRGMRDAILAPLRLDGSVRGVLFVQDRLGDITTFAHEDGQLFETVTAQVASVLDNSRLLDRLRYESVHDALTGLTNREFFRGRLQTVLRSSRLPFAVLVADLDRFKEINDTLGHHYGDLLIREVARRIRAAAPPTSIVSRLGGDEFAVLLHDLDAAAALDTASMIRAAVAEPCCLDGVTLDVGLSVGIAAAPDHGTDETVLLKRADMAMYAAKSAGTGVELYDAARDDYSPRRLALTTELRSAIAGEELSLAYQPQVDAAGRPEAVEALARWRHPTYGEISPAEFVPLAEQSGAIVPLTHWVITRALRQTANWHRQGLPLRLSVNVSMRNLLDADIVDTVRRTLRQEGLQPDVLTLEVTESHIMSDPTRTQTILRSLSTLGVRISIDDFGTGYSSLSYLRQLPVNEIKIDRSFVHDLLTNDNNNAIVAAILSVAHNLGLDTVAEGVEDGGTRAALVTLGCTRQQGFYYAEPADADHITHWLQQRWDDGSTGEPEQSRGRVLSLRNLPTQRREDPRADQEKHWPVGVLESAPVNAKIN